MKIRVMIADDQPILAEGIKSVLENGAEDIEVVALAKDGEDLLAKLEATPADVVLMDIRMPGMNGVVATKEVRARHPGTKVVVLTTFDDSE